jgi:AraC-like DNA-binding protein
MLLCISLSGILMSVILIYFNVRDYKPAIYLGLFFFGLSIYALIAYVLFFSKSINLVSFFQLNAVIFGALIYLAGPALFWYVRSVLSGNHRLKKYDLLHFMPLAIFIIAGIPHLFTTFSGKREAAAAIVGDPAVMEISQTTILSEIVPPAVLIISCPIIILCYTLLSIIIFIRHLKGKGKYNVSSGQPVLTTWIAFLLALILVLEISQSLLILIDFTCGNHNYFFRFNIFQVLSWAGFAGLLVVPFFFPAILYGLPRLPGSNQRNKFHAMHKNHLYGQKINHNHKFEPDYLRLIQEKTDSCMNNHRPYLNPDCNLGQFARLVNLPAHHLAWYFRKTKKQYFNDYRNEWRVSHAKRLIMEGIISKTILKNIGVQSGFSNRNTFLNAFKKFEGISPRDFTIRSRRNSQSLA